MFDRDMRYLVVSRRFLADYDLAGQELIGRSHYDVFPEIPERWKEIHRRCLAGAVERCEEDPFPRQDGTLDWVRWEICPWHEADGEIGGIVMFSEVITERKSLEEALRSNKEFLSTIYTYINIGIFVVSVSDDGEFRYEGINPMHEKLLGLDNSQVAGKTPGDLTEFFGAESMNAVKTYYAECVHTRSPIEFEFFVPTGIAQGWWLSRLTPLFDVKTGRVVRLIGTETIITERKRAEEELRLSRDRLADLTRRLVEAQEVERRAIGRELHDQFGQMLTAIKITLEIAGQLPAEAAAKKIAQAQELATDLLGRVSRLSLELRPAMLDDLGLVPALVWHVNHYQEQTGINVELKHSGVEGERFSIAIETAAYRIVQEALTNIARHAHATNIWLTIGVNEGWLEIRIDNDGVGFDPQAALAKNRGVTGMRERAKLVGGVFQIESERGKGTRTLIRLPVYEDIA